MPVGVLPLTSAMTRGWLGMSKQYRLNRSGDRVIRVRQRWRAFESRNLLVTGKLVLFIGERGLDSEPLPRSYGYNEVYGSVDGGFLLRAEVIFLKFCRNNSS